MMNTHKINNGIGWFGALMVVGAYFLLTFEFVDPSGFAFNMMNLLGGIGLGWRVWIDRNYSNFFLEIIFVAVAVYALIKIIL